MRELVVKATTEWQASHPSRAGVVPPRPLIRLKVETSNFSRLNVPRFGHAFVDTVANAREILLFYRRRAVGVRAAGAANDSDAEDANEANGQPRLPVALDVGQVEDIILQNLRKESLALLPENELIDAARNFVDKQEANAINECVPVEEGGGAWEPKAPDEGCMWRCMWRNGGRFITSTVERTKTQVQQTQVAVEDDDAFKRQVRVCVDARACACVLGNSRRGTGAASRPGRRGQAQARGGLSAVRAAGS